MIEECRAGKLELYVKQLARTSGLLARSLSIRTCVRSHDKYWKNISDDAKAFIRALVKPNPGDRPTAEQALKHKWIIDALNKEHEHDLAATFKENWYACPSRLLLALRLAGSPALCFNAQPRRTPTRKWKQSINTIIASRRFAQAADRARTARATPLANAESTDEDGGGGAGFHTAEEDSDLDSPPAARNADEEAEERRMSEIRHRELEAKRHEREGGPTPPRDGVEDVQQGVEHLSVRG